MMRKGQHIKYGLSLVMVLALIGCNGSGSSDTPAVEPTPAPSPAPEPTPDPGTYPRFDPITGDLPFHIDLLFAGTTDGTANIGPATDPVRAAVNQLDGFSSSAYFDVLLSSSIDPVTAQHARSVWLVELETGSADPLDLNSVTGIRSVPAYDVQVVSLDGGTHNAIRLRPTTPLAPGAKYLVALTDDLRDASGAPVRAASAYAALRGTAPIDGNLQPVRSAVQAWENLAAQAIADASSGNMTPEQARAKLSLSYTFTTTKPVDPLLAMAGPQAAIVQAKIAAGTTPGNAVNEVQQLANLGLLPTPIPRPLNINAYTGIDFNSFSNSLAANVGLLYTGYIKLPYYLQAREPSQDAASFLRQSWRPDATLATALGQTLPADVDGSYNTTWRYPFAAATGTESVPLQLTLPQADWVPGYAGAANCGQIYAASGYPVVMYVHGVTSDRTSVLALAHTLASRCVATVAIDLPLHGVPANSAFVNVLNVEQSSAINFAGVYGADRPRERHFNVAGPMGSPAPMNFTTPGSDDGSGAQFINLANLTGTRDHNRQAVMDLLNLNASLSNVNIAVQALPGSPKLDPNRVYVVGVSLGGIVGSVYATVNQLAIAKDAQIGLISSLSPIRGLIASVAGTQVSQILVRSQTFGPRIDAGLASLGVTPGSSAYERFFYTAQSALDSADPVTFAKQLGTLGVPVLLQQINDDAVVPNQASEAPLAGTAAFARLLGTTTLGLGATQLGRGYVRHTAGGHTSLLRPEGGAPQVTAELQAQAVTFVLNNGNLTVGSAAPGNIQLP